MNFQLGMIVCVSVRHFIDNLWDTVDPDMNMTEALKPKNKQTKKNFKEP